MDSLSRLLDVVLDAQQTNEPKDHEFGSYCFEELEPAKILETVATEVIELQVRTGEPVDCSQKLRKLPKINGHREEVTESSKEMTRTQVEGSELNEYSQNSRILNKVDIFELGYKEKPLRKSSLLDGNKSGKHSRNSQTDFSVKVTEHQEVKEITLPLKPKQLLELQKNDTYCRDVTKKLHKNVELQKNFIKEKGILYHLWTEDGRTFKCILVLQVLQDFMIILAHDYNKHNSSRRTYSCLKQQYYWPGIRKQFFRHCRKCKECILQNQGQPEKCFGHFDSPDLPIKFICMDLVGPIYPPSSRGNKYVLTVIDMLTGFTMAVPIRNKNAENICDVYRDHI